MAKTKLILLIDVDEEALPQGNAYAALPDQLYSAIFDALPGGGLELANMYMANPKEDVELKAREMSLHYHHYAVSVRGEKCEEENCEIHPHQNVINFHDHRQRNSAAPGIN